MAEVSLARYVGPEGFEKQLVIKRVLPRIGDDPRLLRMFFEEAKIQVSLSHGNLVAVFDFGRVGNEYFIAMEYVHGVDLGSLLAAERAAGERLPSTLVAHIGVEICRALAYVHRRGFVHRDVSPRNMLLSVDGEVKLSDFGLALAVESEVVPGLRGTPAFMSPEQARGERIDARADLFATALVLAEALVGRRVRDAPDDAQTLALARVGAPVAVDCPLGEVLARATRAAPQDRFASAEEMLSALERELARAGETRESLVWALAAKVKPLAPRDQPSEASSPRTATAETVAKVGSESYFRDDRSASFVDRLLAAPPAPIPRIQLGTRAVLAGVALLVTGAVVVKVFARPPPSVPVPAPTSRSQQPPAAPASTAGLPGAAPEPLRPMQSPRSARPRYGSPSAIATPAGSLLVQCTPWCVPYLDGKPQASDGRSFVLDGIPAGRHRVEARRLEDRQGQDVEVVAGQREAVRFEFD